MGYITTGDGVRLYYEEAGAGDAVVFVHEFGGNYWSWEPQLSYFSRFYRCITFAARGYAPSDIPEDIGLYSQARAADDIVEVIDGLGIDRAHIVGLSMGGFSCLHAAIRHPAKIRSVVAAGAGYGAEKQHEDYFKGVSEQVARNFSERGAKEFAPVYAEGASRVQFQEKDPRGWALFAERLSQHSSIGAANTMRGVQARRPSLYDLEDQLAALQAPTLVIVGDEDDHCLQPGVFLKRTIPRCGLSVFPKTGHTLNLEEPGLFNSTVGEFLMKVELDRWTPRDPRANPAQIMRTD